MNLNGLHDVMVDAIEDREFSEKEVQDCFNSLPEHIKAIAFEWGGMDTVFCDEAYRFIVRRKVKNHEPN